LAQNVTLLGVDYPDVPSVKLPRTGGGNAEFTDTSISSNAASASDIAPGKKAYVNGNLIEGSAVFEWYATCSTDANTAAKVATCPNFELVKGATVNVWFTNSNNVSNPTLNVNGTGAKPILANNSGYSTRCNWFAGETAHFVYDGNYWRLVGSVGPLYLRESKVDKTTMDVGFTNPTSNNQVFQIAFTVKNQNSQLYNHELKFILTTSGATLWDSTASQTIWSK